MKIIGNCCVVPLVGTWIETEENADPGQILRRVVPLVGTWIETQNIPPACLLLKRRSPRGNVD